MVHASGDTTTGMLNRLQADVLNLHPGKCIVAGGTNDIGLEVNVNDNVMNNLIQIVSTLSSNNIQPFLCTLPPRGNGLSDTALNDLNNRIRSYAVPANGVALVLLQRPGTAHRFVHCGHGDPALHA
jgi:lysophospholipase L1-like esterase